SVEVVILHILQYIGHLAQAQVVSRNDARGTGAHQLFDEFPGTDSLVGAVGALQDLVENDEIIVRFYLFHNELQPFQLREEIGLVVTQGIGGTHAGDELYGGVVTGGGTNGESEVSHNDIQGNRSEKGAFSRHIRSCYDKELFL